MRDRERIGTVMKIEPDQYSYDDPIFHTVFVENGPAIPLRRDKNLRVVQRAGESVSYVLIMPRSNSNPTNDYLVVPYRDWVAYGNGELQEMAVTFRSEDYGAAYDECERLNPPPAAIVTCVEGDVFNGDNQKGC